MRSLSEFLRRSEDTIVTSWCAEVAALPSAQGQGRRVLRDHLPELIDELARALDGADNGQALDDAAAVHAKARFASGYDIREVVTEYQILRRVILDAYAIETAAARDSPAGRVPAVARLDAMIDAAVCDAVDWFVAERERAKDVLVGILSHDLRAPLQSIVIGAEALAEQAEVLGPTVLKIAHRVGGSAKRMGRMIRDLLDFTRAHLGGGLPITPTATDLGDVVGDVVEELAHAHPSRIVRRCPPAPRANLRGVWDPGRVVQAVTNLVGNAIQHGGDPIEVRTVDASARVAIEVRNAGTIAPEIAQRLFEPFAHVAERTSTTTAASGLGLGLYIVSEIARAHGGTVEVDSSDGVTCFRLILPRDAADGRGR